VLAVMALREVVWPRVGSRLRPLLVLGLGVAVLPSNLLVYGAAFAGIAERNAIVFLTPAEARALDWLDDHAPRGALVAASPQMGLYLPGWAGVKVLYGHPFETIHADQQRELVEGYYSMPALGPNFAAEHHVDLVMVGPRERSLGAQTAPQEWQVVYDEGGVMIYAP
jgi:hypothetical protein